jgi:hypothetical protein
MRKIPLILRLVPLAAAALASVATSPMVTDWSSVVSTSPVNGETAVAADVVPEVHLVPGDGDVGAPEGLELHDITGALVPGTSERIREGGELVYRFYPAAPLAPGDYELHATDDVTCYDGTQCNERTDNDEVRSTRLAGFSTISRPTVLAVTSIYGYDGFAVTFSQDMDPASAELMHVLDATGAELRVTRRWQPGSQRVIELVTPPGQTDVLLDDGVRAADGTAMQGLPAVY